MEVFRSSHTHMNDAAAMLMISAGTAIHADRSVGSMCFL